MVARFFFTPRKMKRGDRPDCSAPLQSPFVFWNRQNCKRQLTAGILRNDGPRGHRNQSRKKAIKLWKVRPRRLLINILAVIVDLARLFVRLRPT